MRQKVMIVTFSIILAATTLGAIFSMGWYFGQQSVEIPVCDVEGSI